MLDKRYLVRKQKNFFSRTVFYFILFAFFGAIIYVAIFSPYLEISEIIISGNQDISREKIKSDLDSLLAGKYLKVVSKNNLLFFGRGRIEKKLLEKYKKMREIEIKRNFPYSLNIEIKERQMKMAIKRGEKVFVLDENGQAYDIYSPEAHPDILTLYDKSGKDINLYDYSLETGYMQHILDFKKSLEDGLGIKIKNEIQTPSVISNYAIAVTEESWQIYFSLDIPLEKTIGVLSAAIKEKIEKGQMENLEYIDLRVNNKVFYKFNQEEATSK